MITGHYLTVQRWRSFFFFTENIVKKIATWIRILNFSIELYNYCILWRIEFAIETMLKINKNTFIHSHSRFAKIYVEVDLSKQLVFRILIFGHVLNIKYESLHLIYFSCKKYGH
ncbi:hypothetical protein Ahy_A05g025179 [Arachis hypogaea]|uniref:Uncharacterized protein n=1 Tax=Arachis hypogaea TaxID=3818 RepID=A0A445D7N2_ARAHY|nr:hypothetical protein Ahy_A05g025179 [Arachis hypogaea]